MSEVGKGLVWLGGLELVLFVVCVTVSFGLLLGLRPVLERHALAKPNIRSSHKNPTPRGGGIAVIVATIILVAAAAIFSTPSRVIGSSGKGPSSIVGFVTTLDLGTSLAWPHNRDQSCRHHQPARVPLSKRRHERRSCPYASG